MNRKIPLLSISALALTTVVFGGARPQGSHDSLSYLPPFGVCFEIAQPATSTICPAYGLGYPAPVADSDESDDRHQTATTPEPTRPSNSEDQPPTQSGTVQTEGDQIQQLSSSPWSRGAVCRRVGKDDYCAFTHSTFNSGEGISIITTPSTFLALGSQPPLNLTVSGGDKPATASTTPEGPYKNVALPSKGIGLLATEPIRAGRRIMARTPALMVDDRAFRGLRKDDLALLLVQAIVALPEAHRTRFLNLSSSHDSDSQEAQSQASGEKSQLDLVYKIFTTNAFKTTVKVDPPDDHHDNDDPSSSFPTPQKSESQKRKDSMVEFQSTFTEVSRLNHDCSPNLGYYFDSATLSHRVYAVKDVIMPGEELSVSYVDVLHPRETRQRLLSTTWHFSCTCQRCGGGGRTADDPHLIDESDSRVDQINALRRELDAGHPSPGSGSASVRGTGTPAKALLLITLYELEGADVRIYEAYYRAAVEYNGVGDATNAVIYARMCLAKGLVARGPDRPFVESMKSLIGNPTRHWSWRFRVQGGDQGGGNGERVSDGK